MIHIEYLCNTDLPADIVWAELRHFDRVLNWVPGGSGSTIALEGEGIGMIRHIELTTQGYVQHRLLTFDNEQQSYSYELTGGKPLGMKDYTVTVSVKKIDPHHCQIHWEGRMSAESNLDEEAIGGALKVGLQNMTSGLIAHLKGVPPDYVTQPFEAWQLKSS